MHHRESDEHRQRAQAALQVRQDTTGEIVYEIVDSGELAALPAPAPGDVFVDPVALQSDPSPGSEAACDGLLTRPPVAAAASTSPVRSVTRRTRAPAARLLLVDMAVSSRGS